MESKKNKLKPYIIASALIWAATIIGCALILKEKYTDISLLLSSGATIHLILIGSALAAQKKQGEQCKLK